MKHLKIDKRSHGSSEKVTKQATIFASAASAKRQFEYCREDLTSESIWLELDVMFDSRV